MTATIASVPQRDRRFSEAEWQRRVDLAACYRLMDHFGFSDIIWNHISARVPGPEEHFLINRMGLRYDEITASNLMKLDLDGRVIDGPEDVNVTGFVIHSAIHARRPEVCCVLHSHARAGLGVSALECGLLPMVQDAIPLYGRVAYHPYEGLSTERAERERLAANLGDKNAMILRNHGALTVGRTVAEAFMLHYYLERACQVQLDVMATGREISLPSPEICEKAAEQYRDFWPGRHEWPALIRLLDDKDPSYRT